VDRNDHRFVKDYVRALAKVSLGVTLPSLDPDLAAKIRAIVGAGHLQLSSEDLAQRSKTTLPSGSPPCAVARPADRGQVQEIIRALRGTDIPVFPISTGKNWGYGDACPPMPGALLLDLSRMNRILEVNAPLAYAVIEPGVTQGQLYEYLTEKALPLWMDCTGAGPDASVIGNTLERGFGHTRYGDRFTNVCGIEIILADGELLRTGFGAYPQTKAASLYKTGIGPTLDGLFSQSTLGVVTSMTIWLMPAPEAASYFFISLKTSEAILELIERLRPLFLSGTLRSVAHLFNDRRLLASAARFPWGEADGREALERGHPQLLQRLYKENAIPAWGASGVLTGSAAEVAAAGKTLRRAFRGMPGLDQCVVLSERWLRLAEKTQSVARRVPPLRSLGLLVKKARLGADLLRGKPSHETLIGGHWRARGTAGARQDPLETGSGLIWVSPVLPMTASGVREVLSLCEPIFHEFGFEFQVTLSCVNPRALCAVMSICFDKESADETSRAARCEEKLLARLIAGGWIPYRGSATLRDPLRQAAPHYWETVGKIRKALDPEGRFSADRYASGGP
jgi:4-cresol dehydrogenase (hydroxylating) flavoprotein subunit